RLLRFRRLMQFTLGVGRLTSASTVLRLGWVPVCVCAILLCCAAAAPAQSVKDGLPLGTINGIVTDETGAAIAGATVTWSQDGTSASMSVATGSRGEFSVSPVPSGAYHLAVSSPGFARQVVSGIVSAGGTSQLPPIQLRIEFETIAVDVR